MTELGDHDCAGAIFIFKDDGTELDALREAADVARKHHVADRLTPDAKRKIVDVLGYDPTDASGRFVYVVHSTKRDEFLSLLAAWHERTRGKDTALLIYAHMNDYDMGPTEIAPGVTWRELGDTLVHGVSSLWLAGCESDTCTDAWASKPSQHPVRNWLVSTSTSIYWLPLMPHFTKELSVDPVFMPEQIAAELGKAFPGEVRIRQRNDIWQDLPTS